LKCLCGWIALALLGLAPSAAAQRAGAIEAGLLGRYNWFDHNTGLDHTGGIGARLGFFIDHRFELETQGSYATSSLNSGGEVRYFPLTGRLQYNAWSTHSIGWVFGLGLTWNHFSNAISRSPVGPQGLVGLRIGTADFFSLRADATLDHIQGTLNSGGQSSWNPGAQLGISLMTGGNPDHDKDGVKDRNDRCPGTPPGQPVDAIGCSASQRDSDGDKVSDDHDRCPDTPAAESVDANGCAPDQLDADRDQVPDNADKCPDTPAGEPVDASVCAASQKDSDGDGVRDNIDKCPNTPAGFPVDSTGCIVVSLKPERKALVLESIPFQSASAEITPAAAAILDRMAAGLNEEQQVTVEIGGHSDSTGRRPFNLRLSLARAEAVKSYLVSRGIATERLATRGFGPDVPVDDNRSVAGRARNRRVELRKTSQSE